MYLVSNKTCNDLTGLFLTVSTELTVAPSFLPRCVVLPALYLGFLTKVTEFMLPHFTCCGQGKTTTSKSLTLTTK